MKNIAKKIEIAALKLVVNTVGRFSNGISLAMKEGFTSGQMLDYIYKNEPSGKFGIGKMIDKVYLNHEGWRVVRLRKDNLVANLEKAINLVLEKKDSVRICDVAAGPALYITDVLEKYKGSNVSAEIRDIDSRWLEVAQKRADEKGLDLEHKVANALEKDDFVFEKNPDIFVASGFYDWFDDEEMIKKSMRLIYEALPKNGYFVFTNQAGHVALDLTNELFKDFNNQQLKMVTWDAWLINSWVEEIGFTVLEVKKDDKGYYSNVLALKK